MDADARYALREKLNAQRTVDAKNGTYARAGGVVHPLPDDAPQFVKDYYDYYKTPRGYHPRSLNSNDGWNVTSALSFLNMPLLAYSGEIRSAVLLIHGEKAHSRYFSEDAFKKLKGDNKELLLVSGASHVDLYDTKAGMIPFDRMERFFKEHFRVGVGASTDSAVGKTAVEPMVRLSRITVDPTRIAEYNAFLKEEIETSMRLESGVLTLYAVAEKERPDKMTILEIYADEAAYRSHILTPHFQKYKRGTHDMVRSLELVDATALVPDLKIK